MGAMPPGTERHRSLALASLVESFGNRPRLHVLDLGPAVGGTVEFLASHHCKVYIQDIYPILTPGTGADSRARMGMAAPAERAVVREARDTWEARQEREEQEAAVASRRMQLSHLLEFPADTRFDAVLAWDLLNYLERDEVAALARQLEHYCRPGALLFALISILKTIPDEPQRFRILDKETLAYESRSAAVRPCPRYAPAELNELLRGFQLDRSFLLRHGMQEYLFSRDKG
jgi:hypothetical protein